MFFPTAFVITGVKKKKKKVAKQLSEQRDTTCETVSSELLRLHPLVSFLQCDTTGLYTKFLSYILS